MLDIDHFKQVNDNYGHMVGDEVIRHLSGLIQKHIRETDVSGRYGGEEFAILLADTTIENAQVFAERLRFEVEQATVKYNDIELQYTISMGLAEVDTSVKNYETWIEYADSALYDSKESGRNKISLHAKKS
jgi:diguanylate cyclase (GGDEF)-like protein